MFNSHLAWIKTTNSPNVQTCKPRQKAKKNHQKYGHFPAKNTEYIPWQEVCLDIVGPYKKLQKDKNGKTVPIHLSCQTIKWDNRMV